MATFVLFVSAVSGFNIWVGLTIIHALLTGATRAFGRAVFKAKEPLLFWVLLYCKACVAIISFNVLLNVVTQVLK